MKYAVDHQRVQWRVVDDEVVIVDVDSTYYYGLNRVGTFVWRLLAEEALTLDEIVARVAARYRKPAAEVVGDVQAILRSLTEEHLVKEG